MGNARQPLIPALVATGACSLAASPAAALQLGELEVQSALGQPLRASIAYALRPDEQLFSDCVVIKPAFGLPALDRATITVDGSRIYIRGTAPVREPIAALGLSVDCAYTANLTREYTLMLDPVPLATEPAPEIRFAANDQTPAAAPADTATATPAQRRMPRDRRPAQGPIGPSTTYRVLPGDSLSGIASRIQDRPVGLWPAVEQIFAANPDAFIDGDMNRLKAGTLLSIPAFGASNPLTIADAATAAAGAPPAAVPALEQPAVYEQPKLDLPAESAAETPAEEPAPVESAKAAEGVAESVAAAGTAAPAASSSEVVAAQDRSKRDQTADLTPGDAFVSDESATSASSASAAAATAAGETGTAFRWFLLLGGAGALIGAALFVFGRRSRWTDSPPTEPADQEEAVADDAPTTRNRVLSKVDFDVTDLEQSAVVSELDADLSAGTGLSDTVETAVEDLAFAGDFDDIHDDEDGEDFASAAPVATGEEAPLIIMPKGPVEPKTILESEVLPTNDDDDTDDDYDMSMVLDATKNKFSDSDVTAKQLEAIAVEDGPADDDDEYTLSNALDYDILEQDYEDELTATQKFNREILKAAEELQEQLGNDGSEEDTQSVAAVNDTEATDDEESSISMQSTAILDADAVVEDAESSVKLGDESDLTNEHTSILPAEDLVAEQDEESVEEADEGTDRFPSQVLNLDGEAADSDQTSEMPAARSDEPALDDTNATTELTAEATAQLPGAENDETAEMSVESGVYRSSKTAS